MFNIHLSHEESKVLSTLKSNLYSTLNGKNYSEIGTVGRVHNNNYKGKKNGDKCLLKF